MAAALATTLAAAHRTCARAPTGWRIACSSPAAAAGRAMPAAARSSSAAATAATRRAALLRVLRAGAAEARRVAVQGALASLGPVATAAWARAAMATMAAA